MRILIIGRFSLESFGRCIADALEALGHVVYRQEFGYRPGRVVRLAGRLMNKAAGSLHEQLGHVSSVRQYRFERMLGGIESHGSLDLVLETHDFLWPREIAEIKSQLRCSFAVWFPDSLANMGRAYFLNAPIDGAFFKDPFMVQMLSQVLPGRCFYLPECHSPKDHELPELLDAADLEPYRCDVATAGNMHSYRLALFSQLTEFDVRIWGPPPPLWLLGTPAGRMYAGRPVFGREKAMAFIGARIVLNNLHFSEVWGVNARTFEAAGVGAFQLVDWRPGLSQLFEDGLELVSFRGLVDLKEKIRRYLKDEELRAEIGAAGLKRVLRDHTYEHRLKLMLDTLSGSVSGYPMPKIDYA